MKRLLFVTAMTILTVAAVGGCRGGGTSWFNRGAECEPYAAPCTDVASPIAIPCTSPACRWAHDHDDSNRRFHRRWKPSPRIEQSHPRFALPAKLVHRRDDV